jgi:hypothetical protein
MLGSGNIGLVENLTHSSSTRNAQGQQATEKPEGKEEKGKTPKDMTKEKDKEHKGIV